jgi:hypothetical protein
MPSFDDSWLSSEVIETYTVTGFRCAIGAGRSMARWIGALFVVSMPSEIDKQR